MHPLLSNKEFLVKQRVGMPGDPYSYDVLDPATGKVVMTCTEPALAMPIKALRFLSRLVPTSIVPLKLQRILPFYLEIRTPANFMVMSLRQGWSIFRSRTEVLDGRGEAIGAFVQSFVKRLNTLREKEDDPSTIPLLCDLRDDLDNPAATLQHESFHEFRLIQDEAELAEISDQWTGLAKEVLTSIKHYKITVGNSVTPDDPVRQLILAAAVWLDLCYYK